MKTSGRGQKGQKSRTGSHIPAYFEGGQNRFSQRMPYLGGFKNPSRKEYVEINIDDLALFAEGEAVTAVALAKKGLIRPRQATGLLKILGVGRVDRPLNVTAHKVSAIARTKIERAGGTVSLIEMPTPAKTKRSKTPGPTYGQTAAARPIAEPASAPTV
jgi:large subunit ribosomal protein L15